MDYVTFIMSYDKLSEIPQKNKNGAYVRYIESLASTLENFLRRSRPLFDVDQVLVRQNPVLHTALFYAMLTREQELKNCTSDFENDWSTGAFPGWSLADAQGGNRAQSTEKIELGKYSSAKVVSYCPRLCCVSIILICC